MQKKLMIRNLIIVFLILITAFFRVIPHPYNLAPIGAICLFGAAYCSKRWQVFLLPLLAVFISDLYLNNVIYSQFFQNKFTWFYDGMLWNYLSFIIISLWGIYLFKMINLKRIVIGAIGSALIFFMVSNLGVWLNGNLYASSFSGLINCYINALPFFKNSLLGDLVYTTILFGVFELAQMKLGVTNSATVSKN